MTSRTNSRCLIEGQPCSRRTGEIWSNFLVLVSTRASSDYMKKKFTPLPKATSLSARFYCQNSTCVCSDCSHFIGPLGSLKINQHFIKWSSSSKLLGVTIDNKLTWTKHILELKRGFVNKLNLIKRSRFLPRNSLLDLYFKTHFTLGYICVTNLGVLYK